VNEEDHQRADDLERVLDEGDVARAAKMAKKWSDANAQVALAEVQRRSDAHRRDVLDGGSAAGAPALDLEAFARRDAELVSLRTTLDG
jgi:hypothetical protein